MQKKDDKKKHPRRGSARGEVVRDWGALFARIRDVIDWALDIAVQLARGYDDDIESIERLRESLHAWLAGRRVDLDLTDVWHVLAILFAAIEIDTGIDSSELLAPLRTHPPMLHLPGAARDERPTVVIRRFPRRRNSGAAFTQLAA